MRYSLVVFDNEEFNDPLSVESLQSLLEEVVEAAEKAGTKE